MARSIYPLSLKPSVETGPGACSFPGSSHTSGKGPRFRSNGPCLTERHDPQNEDAMRLDHHPPAPQRMISPSHTQPPSVTRIDPNFGRRELAFGRIAANQPFIWPGVPVEQSSGGINRHCADFSKITHRPNTSRAMSAARWRAMFDHIWPELGRM